MDAAELQCPEDTPPGLVERFARRRALRVHLRLELLRPFARHAGFVVHVQVIVSLPHVGGKLSGQRADLVADIDDRLDWVARGYLDLLLFRFFIRVQVLRLGELADDVVLKVILPHREGLARARILKLFRLPTRAHHSVKVEVD